MPQPSAPGDTYRIGASDPYPDSYDATVQRNVAEQDADIRPGIADPLASIDGDQHVLLGSPIWNIRPPMIMSTFAEGYERRPAARLICSCAGHVARQSFKRSCCSVSKRHAGDGAVTPLSAALICFLGGALWPSRSWGHVGRW